MSVKDMLIDVNTEKAKEFVEMLKELGRVKNENGIFDPKDPLVFEPTFVEYLLADLAEITAHIEDYEGSIGPTVIFGVPLWATIKFLTEDQIQEFADDHCELSPTLFVGVLDRDFESDSEPVLTVRIECDLYDATVDEIRSSLEQLMEDFENIDADLRRAEEAAEADVLARREAERLKKESMGLQGVIRQLDALVGLGPVKSMVKELVAARQNQAQRKSVGLKVQQLSPHLVFTGNPGTGKTTVARLIGRIYKELGLLESGHVVETERAGLIGGYVGQTALKTLKVCEAALGGVLFIDEAYSITNDSGLSFGQECIQTLLTFMENNRGKVAVVVAGYPVEMERFLGSNPGLRSRFDSTIHFPDYSAQELEEIFVGLLNANDYFMGEIALTKLRRVLQDLPTRGDFANGRDVRKLFQKVTTSQAARCVHKGLTTKGELKQITTADVIPYLPAVTKARPAAKRVDWMKFGYV